MAFTIMRIWTSKHIANRMKNLKARNVVKDNLMKTLSLRHRMVTKTLNSFLLPDYMGSDRCQQFGNAMCQSMIRCKQPEPSHFQSSL